MTSQDQAGPAPGSVVVGVDGSPGAARALAWAVDKAALLGPVAPVTAYHVPSAIEALARRGVGPDTDLYRAAAQAALDEAVEAVDAIDPTLAERSMVVESRPGPALCRAAAEASLLVVGTRGRGTLVAGLLGSVSAHCARHSPAPVAVIPETHPVDRPLHRVVVGVDGSDSARLALRWAFDRTDPDGLVVAVGALPMWGYATSGEGGWTDRADRRLHHLVEEAVVEACRGLGDGPDVEVRADLRDARVALRDVAGPPPDLLVVGARGLSEVPFLLLGSVSSALVHHPVVPTVIVRADTDTDTDTESPVA
jgi:nucleotide-binding universal stress UspA family protein